MSGVEATCIRDPRGCSMLLVSNVFYGPSWVQIHKCLEHVVPAPTLITLGSSPAVLVEDSTSNRELIAELFRGAKLSRAKEVHLEGVGFVELENKSKLDKRVFVLPLLSIACVLAIGIFLGNHQQPSQGVETTSAVQFCIVDKNQAEFDSWLSDALKSEGTLNLGQAIQKITEQGELAIVVEGIIGSAAKIIGTASCSDGRQIAINHRVDISGSGAVLGLGQ
jgi:hypothetical protein